MSAIVGLLLDWLRLARSARARPYLLITLCVDSAFIFVFLVVIQSYLQNGSLALPGYALAAYGVAKLAAQLFAGRLIDRLGSAKAAQVGLVVIALGQTAMLGAIYASGVVPLGAAVYGFGSALLWPALFARASDEFPPDQRAKLGSSMTLTTGIALILGLGLGLALPAGFPYGAATAIALTAILLAAASSAALRSAGQPGSPHVVRYLGSNGLRELIATALEPRRLGFAMVVLLESTAVGALQANFRSYGRDLLGVSFRHEILLLAPAMVLGAIAVILGGALADRLGRLPLLGLGFLVAGVAVWLLTGITGPGGLIPIAAAAGIGAGLAMPSMTALSMDLSRTAGQGTVLAWFMTMEGLGHAGGAAGGGWLNGEAGVASALRVVAVLFLSVGGGVVASLLWNYRRHASLTRKTLDPLADRSLV